MHLNLCALFQIWCAHVAFIYKGWIWANAWTKLTRIWRRRFDFKCLLMRRYALRKTTNKCARIRYDCLCDGKLLVTNGWDAIDSSLLGLVATSQYLIEVIKQWKCLEQWFGCHYWDLLVIYLWLTSKDIGEYQEWAVLQEPSAVSMSLTGQQQRWPLDDKTELPQPLKLKQRWLN